MIVAIDGTLNMHARIKYALACVARELPRVWTPSGPLDPWTLRLDELLHTESHADYC